jgi:hypothetical protein
MSMPKVNLPSDANASGRSFGAEEVELCAGHRIGNPQLYERHDGDPLRKRFAGASARRSAAVRHRERQPSTLRSRR